MEDGLPALDNPDLFATESVEGDPVKCEVNAQKDGKLSWAVYVFSRRQ